jgi:hypothetical protein
MLGSYLQFYFEPYSFQSNILHCMTCRVCVTQKSESSGVSYRCSRCKLVAYCSKAHQQLDWKNHKLVCLPLADKVHNTKTVVEKHISPFFKDPVVPVALTFSEAHGHHLIAKKDIGIGCIVLAADVFGSIAQSCSISKKSSHCHLCSASKRIVLRTCENCCYLTYCVECEPLFKSSHDEEACSLFRRLDNEEYAIDDSSEAAKIASSLSSSDGSAGFSNNNCDSLSIGDKESILLLAHILLHGLTQKNESVLKEKREASGVRSVIAIEDVMELVSHKDHYKKAKVWNQFLTETGDKVARILSAPMKEYLTSLIPDYEVGKGGADNVSSIIVDILLKIKFNAFPVVDDSMITTGHGLFPVASYINHSCIGNVTYHCTSNGKTLVFRAVRPIKAGEIISYPYIDPLQKRSIRATLLSDGYLFKCSCRERCEKTISSSPDGLLEAFVCTSRKSEACGMAPLVYQGALNGYQCSYCKIIFEQTSLMLQQQKLEEEVLNIRKHLLEGYNLEKWGNEISQLRAVLVERSNLHRCHYLRYDIALCGIMVATKLNRVQDKINFLSDAIFCLEEVVQVGNINLAHLYYSLGQCLKEVSCEHESKVAVHHQLKIAFGAAYKIFSVCLGDEHRSTLNAKKLFEKY